MAGATGFEPVITVSKTATLDRTMLYPNKLHLIFKERMNVSYSNQKLCQPSVVKRQQKTPSLSI